MREPLPHLHAVTDDRILSLPDLFERARAIASAGDVALHVRGPTLHARILLDVAEGFGETGAPVFVNDRADIARIVGAAGVHAPELGLSSAAIRRIVGEDPWIGRSVHSPEGAQLAFAGSAHYVFLGPIWGTRSHPRSTVLGPNTIASAAPGVVIAIGGVTAERARSCRAFGAYGVAAISALWDSLDPAAAATQLLVSFRQRT